MKYLCNPVNINYRYQFNQAMQQGAFQVAREAADPSMLYFKGKYYIFASMTLGVWVSDDLVNWTNHKLPESMPMYDYAPDVCVIGDYVYWCASSRDYNCSHFRTKDILNGPWEEIKGTFDFWDPHMFRDDDGRVYFFWGCTNTQPIWGVEKDPATMKNIGEPVGLIYGDAFSKGYERVGEDHDTFPASEEEVEAKYAAYMAARQAEMGGAEPDEATKAMMEKFAPMIKGMFTNKPYIEGPWMTKYNGRYYLQYANPGTQYNGYNDGVYVSDKPLGPYTLAENNPFSYKPGGYLPGAGHGSTAKDAFGNYWHTATARISINHNFERRVGLWPVGFDADGEMFCNQRYGDWPLAVDEGEMDPWRGPAWYLLSYGAKMAASSAEEGKGPEKAADENVQTWWRAATAEPGQWLCMDLGRAFDVRMIQINFADDKIDIPSPGQPTGTTQARYIDGADMVTRWILEGSLDGENFFLIEDKSKAVTDLPHDLVLREEGIRARYLKLTICEVPYAQPACISGLRVFGNGEGTAPAAPAFTAERTTDVDMEIETTPSEGAVGYNILWGSAPDKLYHSYMVFGTKQRIGALVKNRSYYVRVDAFNQSGITEGTTLKQV